MTSVKRTERFCGYSLKAPLHSIQEKNLNLYDYLNSCTARQQKQIWVSCHSLDLISLDLIPIIMSRSRVYKSFFMLNSAEHKI